jgi:hypothetical protein
VYSEIRVGVSMNGFGIALACRCWSLCLWAMSVDI